MKILGIDIGGSGIKGAPVETDTGKLLQERFRLKTPEQAKPKDVVKTVGKIVKHFNWKGPIGCGFPAVVQHGIVQTASNIDSSWIGMNVEELIKAETKCPVTAINDADAAATAEMVFGAGHNKKGVVLLLTVGTGIGSSVFTNGTLLPNTEFGHIKIRGIIAEHWASDAIRKREDLSWKKWAIRFQSYLERMAFLLRPDFVIMGGGVSKKFEKIKKFLKLPVDIVPAQLKNEAGIIGAALTRSIENK